MLGDQAIFDLGHPTSCGHRQMLIWVMAPGVFEILLKRFRILSDQIALKLATFHQANSGLMISRG